jgi:uncharacterized protein
MTKIGILSDTHSYLDPRIFEYFCSCDEIWHCGDWGSLELVNQIRSFKPLRGVSGNIDGYEIRQTLPQQNRFLCEGVDVLITHIGGYPGKYDSRIKQIIYPNPPKLFICGHSHILKVQHDDVLNMLCVNPGAAGKYGFHNVQTLIRLQIDGSKINNLEVIELSKSV